MYKDFYADHYSNVDIESQLFDGESWSTLWPNFTPQELACKGTGALLFSYESLDRLQRLRDICGFPLIITSAFRSLEHHTEIYRATGRPAPKRSLHLKGRAFDIRITTPAQLWTILEEVRSAGFTRAGVSREGGFVHIDDGTETEGYSQWIWTY